MLPEDFATTRGPDGRRRGRCVAATRVARAVLADLGVQSRPLACDVMAANAAAVRLIAEGIGADGWPPAANAWSIGSRCDSTPPAPIANEPDRRRSFGGHLVLVGHGWFADLTAQQFHRPQLGILVPGAIVGPYDEDLVVAEAAPAGRAPALGVASGGPGLPDGAGLAPGHVPGRGQGYGTAGSRRARLAHASGIPDSPFLGV